MRDVGFGKTEVAIRAASRPRSTQSRPQCSSPPLLLAISISEHSPNVLKELLCEWITCHARATAKQVKEIVSNLAEGKIDILIGTTR